MYCANILVLSCTCNIILALLKNKNMRCVKSLLGVPVLVSNQQIRSLFRQTGLSAFHLLPSMAVGVKNGPKKRQKHDVTDGPGG